MTSLIEAFARSNSYLLKKTHVCIYIYIIWLHLTNSSQNQHHPKKNNHGETLPDWFVFAKELWTFDLSANFQVIFLGGLAKTFIGRMISHASLELRELLSHWLCMKFIACFFGGMDEYVWIWWAKCCWWWRNPAPANIVNIPIIYKVWYISGGAGFLPSTVSYVGIFVPVCSNPFCKWFWSGFWVPKHLLKGYLEHKGVCVCVECKKVTRDFVGESRFVSYFSVAVEYLAFTKKKAAPTPWWVEKSSKLTCLISIPRWCRISEPSTVCSLWL